MIPLHDPIRHWSSGRLDSGDLTLEGFSGDLFLEKSEKVKPLSSLIEMDT